MDRGTHQAFAPMFAIGATALITPIIAPASLNLIPGLVQIGIAAGASLITSMGPDGDQHSYKPWHIIWGRSHSKARNRNQSANWGTAQRVIRSVTGTRNNPNYLPPKRFLSKVFASILKIMGCKGHRSYKSHSPFIWIPIWAAIYIPTWLMFSRIALLSILPVIVWGLAMGWISHIVGDLFTLDGVELFPGVRSPGDKRNRQRRGVRLNPIRQTLGRIPILKNLPKANNPIWTKLFLIVSADILLMILAPGLARPLNEALFSIFKTLGGTIVNFFKLLIFNVIMRKPF